MSDYYDRFGSVFSIVVLFAFLGASCFAPCSWYGCTPVKDLPARCLDVKVK